MAARPRAAPQPARPPLQKGISDPGTAIRHDPSRRNAGSGALALGRREGQGRARARPPRRPVHRGGLPGLQPQGGASCSRSSPARSSSRRRSCAFGMTRRRDVAAEDDPALQSLTSSFAPVVCLVGKTWALHLDKVTKVTPEENLEMIRDSVAFCAAEGKRVVYDAEHFFDAWRDDRELRAALPRGRGRGRRRERDALRHQRLEPSAPGRRRDRRGRRRARRPRRRSGSTPTTTPSAASRTPSPPSRRARAWSRGRSTAAASAAATPTSSRFCPALQLKMGYDVVPAGPPAAA